MRHYVLISHGYAASGVEHSVSMIMGEISNLRSIGMYVDGNDDLKQTACDLMKEAEEKGGDWIIMTDFFGGSVNNEFMNCLDEHRFFLVAGFNMPLVLELVSQSDSELPTKELIEQALRSSKDIIQLCNGLHEKEMEEEDF